MKKMSTDDFIKKAILIHGDRYDYGNVVYSGSKTKVLIICKKHGAFSQSPNNHLGGGGCKKCAKEKISTENFIDRSIKIHGDKFDYSKSIYHKRKEKLVIGCKEHGEFLQSPDSHYRGRGCPMCANMYPGKYVKNGFAHYNTYSERLIKIGIKTRRNPNDENILDAECYTCGKWHSPNSPNVADKISAANGKKNGENNLYCSDSCKNSCQVFNFNTNQGIDPRSKIYISKTEQEFARKCQTSGLKMVQCDKYGKMHCEKCGNEIFDMDAELHHTLDIASFGKDAITSAGHIILCSRCHITMHSECR